MDFFYCYYKNCPHLYKRVIKGFSVYLCTARKGRKVRETDIGSGRLIQVKRLKECPLENFDKNFPYEQEQ